MNPIISKKPHVVTMLKRTSMHTVNKRMQIPIWHSFTHVLKEYHLMMVCECSGRGTQRVASGHVNGFTPAGNQSGNTYGELYTYS